MAEIVPATPEHAQQIVPWVRKADIEEFRAASGQSATDVLIDGLSLSSEAWAGLWNGRPVCLFGVAPMAGHDGVGVPWLVGTVWLDGCARVFLRQCRKSGMVQRMLDAYPVLMNAVDCRNDRAIQWLKWLGFTFHDPAPYGIEGRLFQVFEMRAKHV